MASQLPLVPGFIARFIEGWAGRRQPDADTRITLVRQRLYILPTRAGLSFFLVLLVILLGAINYQNSIGFMLTFLLASIGALSMLYTHQNLNGLRLSCLPARPVFAGQAAAFPLLLERTRAGASHLNIKFQCLDDNAFEASLHGHREDVRVVLELPGEQRGQLFLPKLKIHTEFPLGLFHAWTWVELSAACLVYPRPGSLPLPLQYQGRLGGQTHSDSSGSDDFAGIREYQKGDAPNHLAWKAIARTGQLQTKLFSAEAGHEIRLSWSWFNTQTDVETRLSHLCRWILDAHRLGLRYGLDIPGVRIEPAAGEPHRNQCLQVLALYGQDDR